MNEDQVFGQMAESHWHFWIELGEAHYVAVWPPGSRQHIFAFGRTLQELTLNVQKILEATSSMGNNCNPQYTMNTVSQDHRPRTKDTAS